MLKRKIVWGLALCAGLACPAQQNSPSLTASFDLRPRVLRHERLARDAKQQTQWDDEVFAFYKADVPTAKRRPSHGVLLDTRLKRMYRTRLRELLRQAPNFAGVAVADKIGCGTSCFSIGIVDIRTGEAYLLEDLSSANVYLRADYRKDSRALHVMGSLGSEPAADRWYVLEQHRLRLVYRRPMRGKCFDVGDFEDLWSSPACNFIADTAKSEPLLH